MDFEYCDNPEVNDETAVLLSSYAEADANRESPRPTLRSKYARLLEAGARHNHTPTGNQNRGLSASAGFNIGPPTRTDVRESVSDDRASSAHSNPPSSLNELRDSVVNLSSAQETSTAVADFVKELLSTDDRLPIAASEMELSFEEMVQIARRPDVKEFVSDLKEIARNRRDLVLYQAQTTVIRTLKRIAMSSEDEETARRAAAEIARFNPRAQPSHDSPPPPIDPPPRGGPKREGETNHAVTPDRTSSDGWHASAQHKHAPSNEPRTTDDLRNRGPSASAGSHAGPSTETDINESVNEYRTSPTPTHSNLSSSSVLSVPSVVNSSSRSDAPSTANLRNRGPSASAGSQEQTTRESDTNHPASDDRTVSAQNLSDFFSSSVLSVTSVVHSSSDSELNETADHDHPSPTPTSSNPSSSLCDLCDSVVNPSSSVDSVCSVVNPSFRPPSPRDAEFP